jgi:hypothetical protein
MRALEVGTGILLSALLLFAAAAKAIAPSAEYMGGSYGYFGVIVLEVLAGIGLATPFWRWAAIVGFVIGSCGVVLAALGGSASCGCLGDVVSLGRREHLMLASGLGLVSALFLLLTLRRCPRVAAG